MQGVLGNPVRRRWGVCGRQPACFMQREASDPGEDPDALRPDADARRHDRHPDSAPGGGEGRPNEDAQRHDRHHHDTGDMYRPDLDAHQDATDMLRSDLDAPHDEADITRPNSDSE